METLLDTYYTVTGAQLRIYYRSSSTKPYIIKIFVDDDEREILFFNTKDLAELYVRSFVRAFYECLFH